MAVAIAAIVAITVVVVLSIRTAKAAATPIHIACIDRMVGIAGRMAGTTLATRAVVVAMPTLAIGRALLPIGASLLHAIGFRCTIICKTAWLPTQKSRHGFLDATIRSIEHYTSIPSQDYQEEEPSKHVVDVVDQFLEASQTLTRVLRIQKKLQHPPLPPFVV
jgi:hypothetical protein